MSKKYTLTVIICSKNRPSCLLKCIESVKNQTHQVHEIVIVSETKLKHSLSLKNITWLKDPNKGLAQARDLGWRHASGDLIAYIDDDVVLAKSWAAQSIEIFENNPTFGGLTGPTIIPLRLLKNRVVFWWLNNDSLLSRLWVYFLLDNKPLEVGKITRHGWWSPGSNFKSCLKLPKYTEVDYLEACNMIVRQSLMKEVNGFDIHFRGTSEWCEVDLAMRIKKRGVKLIFSPLVQVNHLVSTSGVYSKRNNIPERMYNYIRFLYKQIWFSKYLQND